MYLSEETELRYQGVIIFMTSYYPLVSSGGVANVINLNP